MPGGSRTFSEFWYRVANQTITLRARVSVRRQYFRGQLWYLIGDPFGNQFHRVRPAAYRFLARLRPGRTVQQVWEECLELYPDEAPGQEDVVHLLSQLYAANLLHYELPADSEKFFERYSKRRRREVQSRWMNIMFARFPLLDPDAFLKRALPYLGWIFTWPMALVWLATVGLGVKAGIENAAAFRDQSQGILALDNLALLYAGMVLLKALHEFGHALACRRFGGEVHVMGIMLLIFTPLPYVDVTSSWAFRSRRERMTVGAAGMLVEFFVAACAMLVWARTGPGVLHNLAYNMIFVASVSTLLFNGNPLLRYDGYYLLSDALDIPNLYGRALMQLRYLAERHLFGVTRQESPAQNRREAGWLAAYGIASGIYRVMVFSWMALFIGQRFLLAGLIMAVVCVVSWLVIPAGKFFNYLHTSPRLERTRTRSLAVAYGLAAFLVILLGVIPFPSRFRAPGVLEATQFTEVASPDPGYVREALAESGGHVTNGQALVRMEDPDLGFQLEAARAQLEEAMALQRRALRQSASEIEPVQRHLDAVRKRLAALELRQASLTVRAPHDGIWVSPDIKELGGMWISRGIRLGTLVNPESFRFVAVIPQQEALPLFSDRVRHSVIRLRGQADCPVRVQALRVVPAQQERLPSAALGLRGGGDVAVAGADQEGRKAAESFFEVMADVAPSDGVALLQGRTGRIRFDLPWEPLLSQWGRKLRQLVQKTYQL